MQRHLPCTCWEFAICYHLQFLPACQVLYLQQQSPSSCHWARQSQQKTHLFFLYIAQQQCRQVWASLGKELVVCKCCLTVPEFNCEQWNMAHFPALWLWAVFSICVRGWSMLSLYSQVLDNVMVVKFQFTISSAKFFLQTNLCENP